MKLQKLVKLGLRFGSCNSESDLKGDGIKLKCGKGRVNLYPVVRRTHRPDLSADLTLLLYVSVCLKKVSIPCLELDITQQRFRLERNRSHCVFISATLYEGVT